MVVDRYKNGEISFRNLIRELTNLQEIRESELYGSLQNIDPRRNVDIPNELATLVADLALVDKPKSVIDLNCSTGKLLSYFHTSTMVKGYDPNEDMINLGRVIYPSLELSSENPIYKEFNEKYNCVVSCFPRIGYLFYEGMDQSPPLVYMKKALSLLSEEGKLIALISNTFLTAPNSQMFRDEILHRFSLELVVNIDSDNIPMNLRNMSLIVIKKTKPKNTVLMPDFTNNYSEIKTSYIEHQGFSVKVERLKDSRWDPHFYDPRFKKIEEKLTNKNVKHLGEISEVISGPMIRSEERLASGNYLIVRTSHLQNGKLNLFMNNQYIDTYNRNDEVSILQPGDILTPLTNSVGELYIYQETDPPAIAGHNIAIIRSKDNEYIKTYLTTPDGNKLFGLQVDRKSRGSNRNLTVRDVRNVRIPILPINNLNVVSDKSIEHASESELLELKEMVSSLRGKYKKEKSKSQDLTHLLENRDEKINQTLLMFSNSMTRHFELVNSRFDQVDESVQHLIDLVSYMDKDIKHIKSQGLELDEALNHLSEKIDKTVNKITLETYDQYAEKTKEWIVPYWEKLHDLTKRMLPSADMLFENITRVNDSDPSPYILQYCRSLENELKVKIFVAYILDLKERNVDVTEQFAWDLKTNEQGKPLSKNRSSYDFSKTVLKMVNQEEPLWFFELGKMSTFLTKITGKSVERSPILQDFKGFILKYFDEHFVNIELYEKILNVTREYRNKAAHPNEISNEEAKHAREVIQELLIMILKDYKGTR